METTTPTTATATATVNPNDKGALIQVIAEGDSLFGKAFKFLKQLGEHILVEIETEAGKIERVFHKDSVQVIKNNVPTVTTAAAVAGSSAALETAPPPAAAPVAPASPETTAPAGQ